MKTTKSKMLFIRVEPPFKDAIELCAERGNYGSLSNLIRSSLEGQFRKHLTTEENARLVENEKR